MILASGAISSPSVRQSAPSSAAFTLSCRSRIVSPLSSSMRSAKSCDGVGQRPYPVGRPGSGAADDEMLDPVLGGPLAAPDEVVAGLARLQTGAQRLLDLVKRTSDVVAVL